MTRTAYDALPPSLRAAVEDLLGSAVVTAVSQSGGWSPGVASRVRCTDGRTAFVKAVSAEVNATSPLMHRREAEVTAALPASLGAPALLGVVEDGPWVALVLGEVDGRSPAVPWTADELAAAVRCLDRLAEVEAPPLLHPVQDDLAADFTGWRSLAAAGTPVDGWAGRHLDRLAALEPSWAAAAAGDRLLHLDARSDNMLVRPDGEVVLVDWPWAARGAAVLDVVGFAPSAALDGGPSPDDLLLMTAAGRSAEPDAVTALVCALAGLMAWVARQPPEPGLEGLRAFQAAQGRVAVDWLRDRTGWA